MIRPPASCGKPADGWKNMKLFFLKYSTAAGAFLSLMLFILWTASAEAVAFKIGYTSGEIDTLVKSGGCFAGYINNLFRFGLSAVGITAFATILLGAIEYTASAGNSSRQQDAKDRIQSAIYGVVLLLFSYILLSTINPKIVELKPL